MSDNYDVEHQNMATVQPVTNLSYEIFIAAVTTLALAMTLLYYLSPLSDLIKEVLATVDAVVIVPILLFDFARTLVKRQNRLRYLVTWGWLDFLGSFPTPLALRLLRLGRALLAWRSLRAATPAETLAQARNQLAESSFLAAVFVGTIALTAGSIAIVLVEAEAPAANILTGEDAVWWAVVTVATVGYGDFYPVTYVGRLIGVAVIVVGVSIFSILTGFLSTSFQARRRKASEDAIAELRSEIAELRTLLEQSIDERA